MYPIAPMPSAVGNDRKIVKSGLAPTIPTFPTRRVHERDGLDCESGPIPGELWRAPPAKPEHAANTLQANRFEGATP
jgi:hypothetical protein